MRQLIEANAYRLVASSFIYAVAATWFIGQASGIQLSIVN